MRGKAKRLGPSNPDVLGELDMSKGPGKWGGWRRRGRKEEGQEDKGGEDGGEAGGYRLNHQCFECQAWGVGPQQEAQEIRKVGSLLPKWLGGNLIKVRETKKIERQRLR